MNIYLSRIYVINGRLGAIEIVKVKSFTDIVFETIYVSNVGSRLSELSNEATSFDFEFSSENNSIHNFSVTTEKVVISDLKELPEEKEVRPRTMIALWDLLINLAEIKAGYLSEDEKDYGYIPAFNQLKVSSGTMTINIPVFSKDSGWLSKNIISVKDGLLEQNPFYILIPSLCEYQTLINKFNLQDFGEVTINDKSWRKLHYNCDLPLCNSYDRYVYCEPLIAHYVYQQNTLKKLIDSVKAYVDTLISIDKETTPKKSNVFRRANPYGSFFELLDCEKFTRGYGESVLNNSKKYCAKLKENNLKYDRNALINNGLKMGLSVDYVSCMDLIVTMLLQFDKKNTLDSYDYAHSLLDSLNGLALKTNLFLYNVRVAIIYNQAVAYKFRMMESFEIQNAKKGYKVRVKIK